MTFKTKFVFPLIGAGLLFSPVFAHAEEPVENLVKQGHFRGEVRYRYEFVDQDGPAPVSSHARAGTMRTNLGFETGKYRGFQGLLEAQFVQNIGAGRFNDTVNGKTSHPVVADPDAQEINQAWVSWGGGPGIELRLGRQAINLDNQRFIGTVDWRQNDQTFDSLLFNYTGLEKALFSYGYIGNVNRIFGDDHPLGDLDSDSHFANASYQFSDALKLTLYGYWLDFDRLSARSSKTYGLRTAGKMPLDEKWSFSYEAEIAAQSDHGNNPRHYDERYYHIAPALSVFGLTVTGGYEVLGGDGTNAFQTPLATLHKFNGWADKFLDTPGAGLQDAYASASWKIPVDGFLNGVVLTAAYHDFSGEKRGDFGSEFDLSAGKTFTLPPEIPFKKINLLVKYADYDAEDKPYTDTKKAWLQLGVNF